VKKPLTDRSWRAAIAGAASLTVLFTFAVLAGVGFARTSAVAAQYEYGKKVTICHHTHSKKHPFVTITVSKNAVPAHLRHGDTLGPCPSTKNTTKTKADEKSAKGKHEKAKQDKAKHDKAKHDKAKHDKAKSDKAKSDKGKSKKSESAAQPAAQPADKGSKSDKGKSDKGKSGKSDKGHGKPADPGKQPAEPNKPADSGQPSQPAAGADHGKSGDDHGNGNGNGKGNGKK
jgi:hypothetical protein